MSTAKEIFDVALKLEEGKEIRISIPDESKRKSIRVLLYREKTFREDATVTIAVKKNIIFLRKDSKKENFGLDYSIVDSSEEIDFKEEESFTPNCPEEQTIQDLYGDELSGRDRSKIKDYKTISGARATKIRHLHEVLFADERKAIHQDLKDGFDEIGLSDLPDEEKEAAKAALVYNINIRFESLGKKTRDKIKEIL